MTTIAAVSTPFGEGAIGVIRVSGPSSLEILKGIASRNQFPPRQAVLSTIRNKETVVDHALVTYFPGPASYTGEDLVEISCHGGILIVRRVLDALLAAGAMPAEPGEFTQRAFLNGKMDLTQAEAVMDLIQARTDLAIRSANEQLSGKLGKSVMAMREGLLEIRAHVEAYIDFPEEDIDPETGQALENKLQVILDQLDQLLSTADQGRILREGVRTAIVGSPNAGKSSLLNALVGFDRAIVSPTPGTTRDTIEEFIHVKGLALRLIDTAGLRDSSDALEREGIERSRQEIEKADLVLHVADGSQPPSEPLPEYSRQILILNKADLAMASGWPEEIRISCQTGEGLPGLVDRIREVVTSGAASWQDNAVAINARHQASLFRTQKALRAAIEAMHAGLTSEFIAAELAEGMDALGEVAGKIDTEEIVSKIFSSFCLGK